MLVSRLAMFIHPRGRLDSSPMQPEPDRVLCGERSRFRRMSIPCQREWPFSRLPLNLAAPMALPRSHPGRVAVDSSVGFGEPGLGPGTHQGSAVPESDAWTRRGGGGSGRFGDATVDTLESRHRHNLEVYGSRPAGSCVSLEFLRIVPAMASCPVRGTE